MIAHQPVSQNISVVRVGKVLTLTCTHTYASEADAMRAEAVFVEMREHPEITFTCSMEFKAQ